MKSGENSAAIRSGVMRKGSLLRPSQPAGVLRKSLLVGPFDDERNHGWFSGDSADLQRLLVKEKARMIAEISTDQGNLSRKEVLPMASFTYSDINRFSRSSRLITPRYRPLSIIS